MTAAARDFLFVQARSEIGGAEVALLNLLVSNAELRRRSAVVSLARAPAEWSARLRAAGSEVIELLPEARLREPLGKPRAVMALRALARARGARVLIGHGGDAQVVSGVAARLAKARSVFMVNRIHPARWRDNDLADTVALRGPSDLMLAASKAVRAPLEALRPGADVRLLRRGTPLRKVTDEEAAAARAELGVGSPDDLLIGAFGRVAREKALEVFVEAAARVATARPPARFVVVGGAAPDENGRAYAGELRSAAAARGLEGRIVFTGARTDVARLMAACDLVVHPSRAPAACGTVVLEAMSVGRPVVAVVGGGPDDLLGDGRPGLLVPPGDAAALAAAMFALADDPERRRRMGARGFERVREGFTIETMATNLLVALEGLMPASG